MMSDSQKYAGALTFAKRYAFCNAFGILTADEDIDGHAARPKPAAPSANVERDNLKAKLWTLCAPFRGEAKNWLAAESQLRAWKMLDDGKAVSALTLAEMQSVIDRLEIQLARSA